jgi:hypothetical protein
MFKNRTYLQFLVLLTSLLLCTAGVFASEVEKDLGVSKLENMAKIIKPSDSRNVSFKNIKKATVLLTSTLPLFGEVAEDQLAIRMRNSGLDIIRRTKLLDVGQQELMKEQIKALQDELNIYKQQLQQQLELEKQLEQERESLKELKRLEQRTDQILQQIQQTQQSMQQSSFDVVEIGRKLGLDVAFVGTIFEGKRQINLTSEKPPRVIESIGVSAFHVQVIDIKTEQIVLSITLEYEKGQNLTNAVDTMTKFLKDELK